MAMSLGAQGEAARDRGCSEQAVAILEESLALSQELGDAQDSAYALSALGQLARQRGEHGRARVLYTQSLYLAKNLDDKSGIAGCLEGIAGVAEQAGQPERAAQLLGAAEALRTEISGPLSPAEHPIYDHDVAAVQAVLAEGVFQAAWAAGKALSLEEAVAYALLPVETTLAVPPTSEQAPAAALKSLTTG
jgi:tetratricopeptide (TPR) repeat protein